MGEREIIRSNRQRNAQWRTRDRQVAGGPGVIVKNCSGLGPKPGSGPYKEPPSVPVDADSTQNISSRTLWVKARRH